MNNRFPSLLFVTMALLFSTLSCDVFAASYDCQKARTKIEQMICADSRLSDLDSELASAYKAALAAHQVSGYVKLRQKMWLKEVRDACLSEHTGVLGCLTDAYTSRNTELRNSLVARVYSNTKSFSYERGDAVVEITALDGSYQLRVFGGATIHRIASEDAGRPVYTECDFVGTYKTDSDGIAVGVGPGYESLRFEFKVTGNAFFSESREGCTGFAGIPSRLNRVQ